MDKAMLPVSDSNAPSCLSGPRTDEPAKPPPIDPGGMIPILHQVKTVSPKLDTVGLKLIHVVLYT